MDSIKEARAKTVFTFMTLSNDDPSLFPPEKDRNDNTNRKSCKAGKRMARFSTRSLHFSNSVSPIPILFLSFPFLAVQRTRRNDRDSDVSLKELFSYDPTSNSIENHDTVGRLISASTVCLLLFADRVIDNQYLIG